VQDDITAELRRSAHAWHEIAPLTDPAAAAFVREQKIDILIDLSLHSLRGRLLLFAHKPAPVQATYLAYPGTSGMSAIDYRISDVHLDPPENERLYREKSIRLPHTYWCYSQPREAPKVNALPAMQSGHITFGCMNKFSKVSPPGLATWAQLLNAVPDSRLLLHCRPGAHRDGVIQTFAQAGVNSSATNLTTSTLASISASTSRSIPSPTPAGRRRVMRCGWACR
jgi:predicted O-linked N-acetylglucosamine transferase (SPINDLY family)